MTQLLLNITVSFGIILLIGYSFQCVYSALRFFHLAHAVSLALGGYLVYGFSISCGMPLTAAVILSVLGGVVIMLLIYHFIYRLGERKQLTSWKMMVISLGLYVVLQNIISMIWGDTRLSLRTWDVPVGYKVFWGYITNIQIITILVSVALVALGQLFVSKTTIGKKMHAVATNPEMIAVLGISNNSVMAFSLAIGTTLMACAGILIAADVDMTPTMGFDWLLYGVVAMIIGGMGRTRYMVLGALLLATAQHLAAFFLDSKWMNATAYIILIVFLCFRPYGFSGRRLKKTEV